MRISKWAAVIASVLVLLAAGCRSAPVYNVTDAPVVGSKANPSLDEIGRAIQRAGAVYGWQMKQIKAGHIVATLPYGRHAAVVDVNYNVKSYSIQYKESVNLNYDGQYIHRNYNMWIEDLDKGIRAQLSTL